MSEAIEQRRPAQINLDAEQALLSSILSNNTFLDLVTGFLEPKHFADGGHARIYEACLSLAARDTVISAITLKSYFDRDEALEDVGGTKYLARLQAAGGGIPSFQLMHIARLIRDLWLRRKLIEVSEENIDDATNHDINEETADVLSRAESRIFDLGEGQYEGQIVSLGEALGESMAKLHHAREMGPDFIDGCATGFVDIDRLIQGLGSGTLNILGARPGMGKTALALSIALRAKAMGQPAKVAFFSMEMSRGEIARRALVQRCGVPIFSMSASALSDQETETLDASALHMADSKIWIDDSSVLTPAGIQSACQRIKRRHGLDLVIVDHLDFVTIPGMTSRYERVSDAVRGMKRAAKLLDVPFLVLCQLSRNLERRDDKRPVLADLRDSGNIEQDADSVLFLYREHYYRAREEPLPDPALDRMSQEAARQDWMDELAFFEHQAQVIVAKQRNGATDSIQIHWDAERMKFSDAAQNWREE